MSSGNVVAIPPGTRALRIIRDVDSWILWIHTSDFVHGTYLRMYDTGKMDRVTVYQEGFDEVLEVRPDG